MISCPSNTWDVSSRRQGTFPLTHHYSDTELFSLHTVDNHRGVLMKERMALQSRSFHLTSRKTKAQKWTVACPMPRLVAPGPYHQQPPRTCQEEKSLGHTESEIQGASTNAKFETDLSRVISGRARSVRLKTLNYGLSIAEELFRIKFSKVCFVKHFLPNVNKYHLTKLIFPHSNMFEKHS